MDLDRSVTEWIEAVKGGNSSAAEALWNRYFAQIVAIARDQLRGRVAPLSDEEDIALSVLESFCRAAGEGRFPDLADRTSLWRLLMRMTARKAIDARRHAARQRRGGAVVVESLEVYHEGGDQDPAWADLVSQVPAPDFAAMMVEQCQRHLELLPDEELRRLAIGKMEGFTNDELASQLHCSVRTVERRLELIRQIWTHLT